MWPGVSKRSTSRAVGCRGARPRSLGFRVGVKGLKVLGRPMTNKPPPCKGRNIRIPIVIPIKGRGFINQGFGV